MTDTRTPSAVTAHETSTANPTSSSNSVGEIRAEELRPWGNLMCLWRLCQKPACVRVRACRGDARRCFPRNFALLPEGVQAWFEGLGELQNDGVAFDDAMEELDAGDEGNALRDWYAAVARSLGEPEPPLLIQWWR